MAALLFGDFTRVTPGSPTARQLEPVALFRADQGDAHWQCNPVFRFGGEIERVKCAVAVGRNIGADLNQANLPVIGEPQNLRYGLVHLTVLPGKKLRLLPNALMRNPPVFFECRRNHAKIIFGLRSPCKPTRCARMPATILDVPIGPV